MRINKFVINYLIGITYKEDLVADNFSDILSFDHPETIEDTTNRIKEYLDKFEYIRCDMVDYDLERTPFVTNDLIFKFEDTLTDEEREIILKGCLINYNAV